MPFYIGSRELQKCFGVCNGGVIDEYCGCTKLAGVRIMSPEIEYAF